MGGDGKTPYACFRHAEYVTWHGILMRCDSFMDLIFQLKRSTTALFDLLKGVIRKHAGVLKAKVPTIKVATTLCSPSLILCIPYRQLHPQLGLRNMIKLYIV